MSAFQKFFCSKVKVRVFARSVCFVALVAGLSTVGCGVVKDKPFVKEEGDPFDPTTFVRYEEPGDYPQSWELPNGRRTSFSISLPESIQSGNPQPLILALHEGVDRLPPFFGVRMIKGLVKPSLGDMEAIIVAPDAFKNKVWTNFRCEEVVMELLEKVCEVYPVDRNRILVVGYGMGAEGAWHFAGKYPNFFTGAIPVAGAPVEGYNQIEWTVPMLVVHSKADELYSFRDCEAAVNSIAQRGGSTQLYPLDEFSHYENEKYVEPLKEALVWFEEKVWPQMADAQPAQTDGSERR